MAAPVPNDTIISGDTPGAIDFLKHWEPNGFWVLTAIEPDTRKVQTQTYRSDQAREAEAWINWQQGKRNIYFSVNRVDKALKDKAGKDDIKLAVALHVDIDPPKALGDATLQQAQDAILEKLQAFKLKPSIVLFSGGGYQAFWLLADGGVPIGSVGDYTTVEAHNRWLEKALGGDHCHNIDRIMRLPGTINVPDKKKIAAGRVRALAGLVWADWDARYEVSSFGKVDAEIKLSQAADGVIIPRRDVPQWVQQAFLGGAGGVMGAERGWGNDRSRAVFSVSCALVRCGWGDEEIAGVLLDKGNGISEHIYDQPKPLLYAQRQAQQARAKVGEGFTMSGNRIAQVPGNMRLALVRLGVEVSYNAFAMRYMVVGPGDLGLRRLDDSEVRRIYFMICERWPTLKLTQDYLREFLYDEGMKAAVHPVRDYLDSLKWDGVKRVDGWLVKYCGAPVGAYTQAVGRIMLIAAVRRVRQPACKFDEMVVFESPQGWNKSTALQCLAVNPDWFSDSIPLDKDEAKIIEAISGKWIIEASELNGLRGAKVEHLKALLARNTDRARLAYGHIPTEVARQCIIVGTTNNTEYLRDLTGNRRYWPVRLREIDIALLTLDRDQLWAEASVLEAAGESIRLARDLWGVAAAVQKERMVNDPWEETIVKELGVFNDDGGKIRCADMWDVLGVGGTGRTQEANVRLGDTMRALGWERKQRRVEGKVAWCYVKGEGAVREETIICVRDDRGVVSVRKPNAGGGGQNGGGVTPPLGDEMLY